MATTSNLAVSWSLQDLHVDFQKGVECMKTMEVPIPKLPKKFGRLCIPKGNANKIFLALFEKLRNLLLDLKTLNRLNHMH